MGLWIERFKNWWTALEPSQRALTLFGGGLFAVFLAATVFFTSRPQYVVLHAGLAPEQQASIVEELRKQGIEPRYDRPGVVEVANRDRARADMALATAGKLPNRSSGSMADLESMNKFTTPTLEKELVNNAKEQDLARSIETLDTVDSATVKVNWGERTPFARDRVPPSATVILREKPGAMIDSTQARSVAGLITGSVSGMTLENVKVISASGAMLWDGQADSSGTNANSKLQTEVLESRRRSQELQAMLDQAFGSGNTLATVQVELGMDQVEKSQTTYGPSDKPVRKQTSTESYNGADAVANGTVGGAAGMASNTPLGPSTTTGDKPSDAYTSRTENEEYLPILQEERRKVAAGQVTNMKVSVMVNEKSSEATGAGLDATAVTAVESFVRGYMGLKPREQSDEKVLSVTSFPFDTKRTQEVEAAAKAEASRQRTQQILSILPIAALLLAAFLVVRAIGKVAKSAPLPRPALALEVGGAAHEHSPYAELDLTPEQAAAFEQGIGTNDLFTQEPVNIDPLREKVDVPLEQIKAMASKKPEAVAMLLKGWMMEERR